MSQAVLDALKAKFATAIPETYTFRGDDVAFVEPTALAELCGFLKYDPAMDMKLLLSVTAVDYLGQDPRFEVVYNLTSMTHHHRVRLRVKVGEKPRKEPASPADGRRLEAEGSEWELPSVAGIWRTANWWERHVFDLYGLRFTGHPDLRRLYMPQDWDGHPLRKDYPLRGRQPIATEKHIPDLIRGPGPQPRDFDKSFPGRAPRR